MAGLLFVRGGTGAPAQGGTLRPPVKVFRHISEAGGRLQSQKAVGAARAVLGLPRFQRETGRGFRPGSQRHDGRIFACRGEFRPVFSGKRPEMRAGREKSGRRACRGCPEMPGLRQTAPPGFFAQQGRKNASSCRAGASDAGVTDGRASVTGVGAPLALLCPGDARYGREAGQIGKYSTWVSQAFPVPGCRLSFCLLSPRSFAFSCCKGIC